MASMPSDILGDIYDGCIWQECLASRFLQSPYCYLMTLNVDWFQPFEHTNYSVGAIYLVVQNLPRHECYKEENVILVGVLPGPHLHMNLAPLVDELKGYSTGFRVCSPNGTQITVRVMLTCISCDIPAVRKVCGFLSHSSKLVCNKCYKVFEGTPGEHDYSGFNRSSWKVRTAEDHRKNCHQILKQVTKSAVSKAEAEYGCCFSALLWLDYYDPIRFVAIDIMHNLYLGTAKHFFNLSF